MKHIEEKIKPLVDALNKVPYIQTFSSCEGHYDTPSNIDNEANQYAQVQFEIKENSEPKFENLAQIILSQTAPDWSDILVRMFKEYYVCPHETELNVKYALRIEPFDPRNLTAEQKRIITDREITKIISIIEEYLTQLS